MNETRTSTKAVIALVLGIAAATVGWLLAGLLAIPAIVAGHLALADTRDDTLSGRGMAIAGLVLGYVGAIPLLLAAMLLAVEFMATHQ